MRGVSITIDFTSARFHGSGSESQAHWPPAPSRVFQALVSGASALEGEQKEQARAALMRLEETPSPVIYASRASDPFDGGVTYVRNKTAEASQTGEKLKVMLNPSQEFQDTGFVFPDNSRVIYHVDAAEDDAYALDRAASLISWIGTTQSPATVSVTVGEADPDADLLMWVPGSSSRKGHRVWTSGLLGALDERHDRINRDRPAPHADRFQPRVTYRPVTVRGPDLPPHVDAVLDTPVSMEEMGRIIASLGPVRETYDISIAPLTVSSPHYPRGRAYGVVVTGDTIYEAAPEIFEILDKSGHGTEDAALLPRTVRSRGLIATHVTWTSAIAADLPGTAEDAASYARSYLAQRHGYAESDIYVEVARRTASSRTAVAPGHPSARPWEVTVTFPEPVQGPVFAGISPHGPAGLMTIA